MGCVGRLSSVELDIFLTSASPDQRDIIARRAGDLAERVSKDKDLTGYLLFEGPGDRLVFAIGLTGARTVTLHLMPYHGSPELQDRYGAAFGPFQVGKDRLRFADPAELPVDAIGAVAEATPGYLGTAITTAQGRPRRWGRRRQADG